MVDINTGTASIAMIGINKLGVSVATAEEFSVSLVVDPVISKITPVNEAIRAIVSIIVRPFLKRQRLSTAVRRGLRFMTTPTYTRGSDFTDVYKQIRMNTPMATLTASCHIY